MSRSVMLMALGLTLASGCQSPKVAPPSLEDEIETIHLEIPKQESTVESRRVLVVCNINSSDSIKLTEYYARKRKIPAENIVQIQAPTLEEVVDSIYKRDIEQPIRKALRVRKERIDYIVLTRGVPLRVESSWGYSVDSLLVGLNKNFELQAANLPPQYEAAMRHANPYFEADTPFASSRFGIYLVTRLDGYTLEDAKRLVERSVKAKPQKGLFMFDLAPNRFDRPTENESSGWHSLKMESAARILRDAGFKSLIENASTVQQQDDNLIYKDKFLLAKEPLMGYVTWGSNDASFDASVYQSQRFLAGSIAETFVSTSARTFIPTDQGQSLIGDLIANGVTGVKGYVSEPWTVALCRVDTLFKHYTQGYNLAESFYAASPLIKWKDVVIGDPLCRPYGEFVDGGKPKQLKP
ncbi:MAG: TIGR03790 family protein [Fimbriimonadaceae bacterium]|nr:TIGR03790 family protein [Fimbriimonadaceae bacterium]